MRKRKYISWDNRRFIEAYMDSDFNWQVAERLGVSEIQVAGHAAYLRRRGVNLPNRYPRLEVEELNEAIAEIEKTMAKDKTNG